MPVRLRHATQLTLILLLGCRSNKTGVVVDDGAAPNGRGGVAGSNGGTPGPVGSGGSTPGATGMGGVGPPGATSSGGASASAAGASGQAGGGGASGNHGTGGEGTGGSRLGGAGAPGQGAGGTGSTNACSFSIEAQISPKIAEVGIVTWSTTLADVRSAHIEFGETTAYGLNAPVDLASPGYRTLLLGMRSSKTYHFRVVATASSGTCASEDQTMTTGALPSSLPKVTVTTAGTAVAPFGGYLLLGPYQQSTGGTSAPVFFVNGDGDIVWTIRGPGEIVSARMNPRHTHVWMSSANVPPSKAVVHRIGLDGLLDEDLSASFEGQHYQLSLLPDDTVVFPAYGAGGCDDIKEHAPGGPTRTIANVCTLLGAGSTRVFAIEYSAPDDAIVFFETVTQSLVKISRAGALVWILGGSGSTFAGDTWRGGVSGFRVLAADRLLVFVNNSTQTSAFPGTGTGSYAVELVLDRAANTVKQVWSYQPTPAIQSDVLGDVQRLPDGHTLVAFSVHAIVHEVDAGGSFIREWKWASFTMFSFEGHPSYYRPPVP